MDNIQDHLERNTIFENAVVESAEAHAALIVGEAEKKRTNTLRLVRRSYATTNHDHIMNQRKIEQEVELSIHAYHQRQQILKEREDLVAGLFKQIEDQIVNFTKTPAYEAFLLKQVDKHLDMAGAQNAQQTRDSKTGNTIDTIYNVIDKIGQYVGPNNTKTNEQVQPTEDEPLIIYLRPQDVSVYGDKLANKLKNAVVKPNKDIFLGGVQITNGHILYDETLDSLFRSQKQNFLITSGLTI